VTLYAGTSGWSYDEWKGAFYPPELASGERLGFYAARLPAVEVNNTFYRLPRESVLAGWAEQVPDGFRFAVKASRRITHMRRLREVGEPTASLLHVLGALGDKLGPVLFQLPPNLKLDLERLDAFLALLPDGLRAAFECRHPSWSAPEVFERLRARDFAWVGADTDEVPLDEPISTASWGYLRLRRTSYTAEDLAAWSRRLRAAGWSDAHVFFKHEDAGTGPAYAAALLAASGPAPRAARPPARARAGESSR
jgi:uncharacterized protein YecE (DUF72 family)